MNRFIGLILVASLSALGCAVEPSTESESTDYGLSSSDTADGSFAREHLGTPAGVTSNGSPNSVNRLEYASAGQANGPLPEPWTSGPLPEPWSSSTTTSTSTTTTNNGSTTTSTTSTTTSSGGKDGKNGR